MTALAVLGKVVTISSIEGADFIRQATVVCGESGKWSGVVGMDIHPGDLVTVFLQDAILPPDPRWAFMEKSKWRVRMARFRGCPSECVIVKVGHEGPVGLDMTDAIGVTKYVKVLPESMAGDAVGNFPSFIPKTDEINFQAVDNLGDLLEEHELTARLKYDGSSGTAWNDEEGNLHVASRNLELREFNAKGAGNAYWRAARKYDTSKIPFGCALQFEVIGPGIQGNPLGLSEVEGRAFTLYSFQNHKRCNEDVLQSVCYATGMPIATAVFKLSAGSRTTAEELRRFAEVKYPNGRHAEGLVLRSFDGSVSFKVINLLYKERD